MKCCGNVGKFRISNGRWKHHRLKLLNFSSRVATASRISKSWKIVEMCNFMIQNPVSLLFSMSGTVLLSGENNVPSSTYAEMN